MTDQELKELLAKLAVESEAGFAKLRESQIAATAAAQARQEAADARQVAADARQAVADARQAAADARLAEADARQAKMDARFDKLAAKYGGISENLGAVTEEFFYNSLKDAPVVGGIRYDDIRQHTGVGTPKSFSEIDLWLENGSSIAVVEVKHKVHPKALDQLEQQMKRVREFCPEYKDYALYGGIAGFSIPDEVVAQAKARGLFVLKCKGEVMEADSAGMRAF